MIKTRDSVFDIMKGVAILLVILAHTEPSTRSYSFFAFFRSSLFFVISGYFAKEWLFCDFMKKGIKRLVIPIVFTSVAMLPIVYLLDIFLETNSLNIAVKSLLLGTASWPLKRWDEICVVSAGPLWFLWATILVRIVWLFLQKKKYELLRCIIVLVLAIASYKSKLYFTLPFSIQASFCALGFFYAGYLVKRYDLLKSKAGKKTFVLSLVCLVYCVGSSRLDINLCVFEPFYIINVLSTFAGFYILYALVCQYKTESRFWSLLNFVGRYSLVMLCVHAVDQNICVYWFPYKLWSNFVGEFQIICAVLLRMMFAVGMTYLISKNRFLCEKIFFIK